MTDDAAPDGRDESRMERADRNYAELLQELRVLQTGVQILFGFLLIVSVQPRMADPSRFTQGAYLVTLALCCLATTLLMGPAVYHRVLFGKGRKTTVVSGSHLLTHLGVVALMLAIASALLLVVDLIVGRSQAWRSEEHTSNSSH